MNKDGFKNRLEYAVNTSTKIPDHGFGRQVQIAKSMGVSQEAVRKWFAGESTPRANMMKNLAKFLEVNYIWLSLGNDQKEISFFRETARRQDAAVYAFVAYLMLEGYTTAFPNDEAEIADVVGIKDGKIKKFCVYSSEDVSNSKPNFKFKSQPDDIAAVCAINSADKGVDMAYTFFKVPKETVKKHLETGCLFYPVQEFKV